MDIIFVGVVVIGVGAQNPYRRSQQIAATIAGPLDVTGRRESSQAVSRMNVGKLTPRKGWYSPRTWQKWSSQFFAPQS